MPERKLARMTITPPRAIAEKIPAALPQATFPFQKRFRPYIRFLTRL